jgi:hypothetical protein
MALEIASNRQRLLFVADAIVHPLHLERLNERRSIA